MLPLLIFASARAGVPLTPLNYRLGPEVLRDLIGRLDDPLVVVDAQYREALGPLDHVIESAHLLAKARTGGPIEVDVRPGLSTDPSSGERICTSMPGHDPPTERSRAASSGSADVGPANFTSAVSRSRDATPTSGRCSLTISHVRVGSDTGPSSRLRIRREI
jgi:hypothetical protein